MPDEDKTTNTNQPTAPGTSAVDQPDPTVATIAPTPSPTATPNISGQTIDAPPPPPMEDGAVSPPPPIVEERKSDRITAPPPAQETETNENTQTAPDIPPMITTSGTKGKRPVGKKMIATILGILVLVGGIGVGVVLVQKQQDIREKAAVDEGGGGGGTNDCVLRGGACYSSPSCSGLNRRTVNGGNGCNVSAGEICCTTTTTSATTPIRPPTTTTTTEKAGYGRDCVNNRDCYSNICTGGKCAAPSNRFCEEDTCDLSFAGKSLSDSCFIMHYSSDDKDDQTVVDNVIAQGVSRASLGAVSCGAEQIDVSCDGVSFVDGVWRRYPNSCTNIPTSSSISASCLNIQAFDAEWNSITNLSSLAAGDVVRFTVAGNTSSGSFDRARFTINGTPRPEVSAKKPGTNEFYDEYTIPEGVTTFTINAEVHHTSLGWF